MRGLVGRYSQSMSAKKAFTAKLDLVGPGFVTQVTGDGAVTYGPFEASCWVPAYLIGGGAGGSVSSLPAGAGGGAAFKMVFLPKGSTLTVTVGAGGTGTASIGNPGGDTTLTTSDGKAMSATGATFPGTNPNWIPTPGIGVGGSLNRRGGAGGYTLGGGQPNSGNAGEYGGAGGVTAGTNNAGGGAGGFSDLPLTSFWGAGGAPGAVGGNYGGGGGTGATGSNGAPGVAKFAFIRART